MAGRRGRGKIASAPFVGARQCVALTGQCSHLAVDLTVLRPCSGIAGQQSFTAAVERLFVTQPTLSRQIADLEEELGQKLFNRTTRSLELTEQGHLLFHRAQDVLALVDRTKLETVTTEGLAGDIRISAAETPAVDIEAEAAQHIPHTLPPRRI